jgi:hypothetical protein
MTGTGSCNVDHGDMPCPVDGKLPLPVLSLETLLDDASDGPWWPEPPDEDGGDQWEPSLWLTNAAGDSLMITPAAVALLINDAILGARLRHQHIGPRGSITCDMKHADRPADLVHRDTSDPLSSGHPYTCVACFGQWWDERKYLDHLPTCPRDKP